MSEQMLALLGFATIIAIIVLLLRNVTVPAIAFIGVSTVTALILVLTGTLPDNTGNGECGLCIYTGNLIHHFLGLDHDLRRAIKVTQNQEAEIFTYSS